MSIVEIRSAIESLSEKERCELSAWLQNLPADDWDRQMAEDARAGRFDALVREAEQAFDQGECRPFPQTHVYIDNAIF